ncbi:DUF2510 domain-containing protein [Cnuibacter physcomitrellae]|nr:DUF2510 domain-containing protein [Cnuibacter physcomitrellae]
MTDFNGRTWQAQDAWQAEPVPLPPPGWYPEPLGSGRDRWWTGTEWSDLYARNPNGALDMGIPGYTRAMRPAMNRDARIAKWTGFAGVLLGILSFVVAALLGFAGAVTPSTGGGLLSCFVVGLLLDIVAVICGARGIRRASRLGGLGAAIYGTVVGSLFGLVSVLVIALVLIPAI